MNHSRHKVVVAVTGASGSLYARQLLRRLSDRPDVDAALVFSKNAPDVWQHELGEKPAPSQKVWDRNDFMAPFASGSAKYQTMIIIPCSMGTLGRIANGISDDLITRAADVMLKERRKLICVVRDTPYNLVHIRNMEALTLAGAIILPASPSFYSRPQTFDDLADTVVNRVMDIAGIDAGGYEWGK